MILRNLKQKLINLHGSNAQDWISNFKVVLDKCIEKWQLTGIEPHTGFSYNVIYFASSPMFHEKVVLKLGVPNPWLSSEIEMLKLYKGAGSCKLLDYDEKSGALLLERIIPGDNLKTLNGIDERIEVTVNLINKTALPLNGLKTDMRIIASYSSWLSRAFERVKKENSSNERLMLLIGKAEEYYEEISQLNLPKFALHGDLHHQNILKGECGVWRSIDPQGVIAERAFAPAVFIRNEIREKMQNENKEYLTEIITPFSRQIDEPVHLTGKCAFIDNVLSACWDLEEGTDIKKLERNLNICELFLNTVKLYSLPALLFIILDLFIISSSSFFSSSEA